MSDPVPRLRVFAGPNGSGKSTIKDMLPAAWLGIYVNADEIEKTILHGGALDLAAFGVRAETVAGLLAFLRQAPLLVRAGLQFDADRLALQGTRLAFGLVRVNSYHASVLADFIRQHLLASRTSFTFETVMSSADKVEFLRCAREGGFRTYLYFVATEDPEINISRVQHRVRTGGHPVPTDKIVSRYHRSLDLLPEALAHTSRAYVFDNSGHERVLIAEVTDGVELEMKTDGVPAWFAGALGLDTPPEVTGV
ncbi:MAG: hypothetical protein RL260_3592 [Pseudomonadota bacterium]